MHVARDEKQPAVTDRFPVQIWEVGFFFKMNINDFERFLVTIEEGSVLGFLDRKKYVVMNYEGFERKSHHIILKGRIVEISEGGCCLLKNYQIDEVNSEISHCVCGYGDLDERLKHVLKKKGYSDKFDSR